MDAKNPALNLAHPLVMRGLEWKSATVAKERAQLHADITGETMTVLRCGSGMREDTRFYILPRSEAKDVISEYNGVFFVASFAAR